MRDHEAVAGYLGGDVEPAGALPGETPSFASFPVAPLEFEPSADPLLPETMSWRDIESLLDRIAPPPRVTPTPEPDPLTVDRGGSLRRGPLAWLVAVGVLIGVALVLGYEAPEPDVHACPPVHAEVTLKRAMLETVLASERRALGLPPS